MRYLEQRILLQTLALNSNTEPAHNGRNGIFAVASLGIWGVGQRA